MRRRRIFTIAILYCRLCSYLEFPGTPSLSFDWLFFFLPLSLLLLGPPSHPLISFFSLRSPPRRSQPPATGPPSGRLPRSGLQHQVFDLDLISDLEPLGSLCLNRVLFDAFLFLSLQHDVRSLERRLRRLPEAGCLGQGMGLPFVSDSRWPLSSSPFFSFVFSSFSSSPASTSFFFFFSCHLIFSCFSFLLLILLFFYLIFSQWVCLSQRQVEFAESAARRLQGMTDGVLVHCRACKVDFLRISTASFSSFSSLSFLIFHFTVRTCVSERGRERDEDRANREETTREICGC